MNGWPPAEYELKDPYEFVRLDRLEKIQGKATKMNKGLGSCCVRKR